MAATKSIALAGTGAALMVAGDISEDKTRLTTFLQSVEKATGYALTKETSENNKLERESENSLNSTQETLHKMESGRSGSNSPTDESLLERTTVSDRTRDTSEISMNSNRISKRDHNRGQSLNM